MRNFRYFFWLLLLMGTALGAAELPNVDIGQPSLPNLDVHAKRNSLEAESGVPEIQNSMYFRLGIGSRWFTQTSTSSLLFDPLFENFAGKDNLGSGIADAEISLGFQSSAMAGLEIGFEMFPIDTLYVMPVIRMASPGLGSQPLLHTFGLQLGWSFLAAASSGQNYGNYYYSGMSAQDFASYGLYYRIEQMVSSHFSVGLEIGYRFASTTYTYQVYDPYTYNETSVTDSLNYSGPSLRLTLARWGIAPFKNDDDLIAEQEKQDRRQRRLQERLDRLSARNNPEYDSAADALTAGNHFMAIKRLGPARYAYQQATLLDPKSSNAWLGLANAEFSQGDESHAYIHYQQALSLNPGNKALGNFLQKLKRQMDQK